MPEKDFLKLHLQSLPYFRSLVRAIEARFYQPLTLEHPILDIGSGDGHFASVTFSHPLDVGIDPWKGPLRKSQKYGIYRLLIEGDAGTMPFDTHSFATIISNSVLEHIPHLDTVIHEVARVLKPGGQFIFCVPNHHFLPSLSIAQTLDRWKLFGLASRYRRFFNYIARHHHCDSPEVWTQRLHNAGFVIEQFWHYLSPQALHVVEWGHYFGLPSLLLHALTRKWIISPADWNLAIPYRLTKPFYENPICDDGVCTFYIARRQ